MRQRNPAINMTARTVESAQSCGIARLEVTDLAQKSGDPNVGGNIVYSYSDPRRYELLQQNAAGLIISRRKIYNASEALVEWLDRPQRKRVTLNKLVKRRVDRLNEKVPRGEPIIAHEEIARGLRPSIINLYNFCGHPAWSLLLEVEPFDPA